MPVVTKDATSGEFRPASIAEVNSLIGDLAYGMTVRQICLCQDAGPDLSDASGNSHPLVFQSGSGVSYQQTVAGRAAKAMVLTASQLAYFIDFAFPDASSIAIALINLPSGVSSGNNASVLTFGSTYASQVAFDLVHGVTPTEGALITTGDTFTNGAGGLTGVRWVVLQARKTQADAKLVTALDNLSHATTAANSWGQFTIGGNNASFWEDPGAGYLYIVTFTGSATEAANPAYLYDRFKNGPAITSIALSPSSATISTLGGTQAVTATATLFDTSTKDVTSVATWSSDAPSVATVSPSGVVTAVASGTAHITCTYQSALGASPITSSTCTITVSTGATVTSVSVTPAVGSCVIGGTKQFTAIAHKSDGTTQDVTSIATWSSSNPAAATVAAGLATGVSIGGTNITASNGGHSDTSLLTVLVNAGVAGDLADQQSALFGEDIWYDVSHPDNTGYADLIVDAGGDWQDVTGIEALRQSLLRRLITNPGEWQTVPDYGVGARQYIKAPMTPSTLSELEARIRSQYLRDDRVEAIDSITITPLTGDQPGIYVLVNVIPKGRLRQDASLPVAITIT